MAVKSTTALKAQLQGTDPQDQMTDLVDSLAAAASATAAGLVELATNAEARTGTDTARAVTPANVRNVLTGIKLYTFDGAAAAGAITLTGAAVGDIVLEVAGLTAGALGNANASFEATITVINQIQQVDAANLSANDYIVILLSVA